MRNILGLALALCLVLPMGAGAERYDNWYDMHRGVMEAGDNDAVYTGGDRTIGATYFDLPQERGEVRISADPPVHIKGSVVVNGGTFVFSGIDLTSATRGDLRREPLEVVGSGDNIPNVTFHGNLSGFGNGRPRWGLACVRGIVRVVGDVSGGYRGFDGNRALLVHNAQVTVEGKVHVSAEGAEDGPPEASWLWLVEGVPEGAEYPVATMDTWVKIIDPETGAETVFTPEDMEGMEDVETAE